jgi:hypothetical protein
VEAALIASRGPGGFACPACGCGQSSSFRREGRLYFQCTACRHQCSVISGTIFEATKLGLKRWFLAMHLLSQSKNNVAALELMRHLGVCYKTAWLVKHKLMEVMRGREDGRQLEGRVEIDDAYLGGERSGGRAGRGSENKAAFVAAVQTTPVGQPQFVCLRQQPFTHERWRCLPRARSRRRPPSFPTGCGVSTPCRSSALTPSTDSTAASICAPSWPACCAPPAFPLQPRPASFGWLRLVANQVRPRPEGTMGSFHPRYRFASSEAHELAQHHQGSDAALLNIGLRTPDASGA